MVTKVASYVLAGTILAQVLPVIQSGSVMSVVVLVGSIIGSAWKINRELKKIYKNTSLVSVEHEMLIGDFCERKNIRVEDLPTRRSLYSGD